MDFFCDTEFIFIDFRTFAFFMKKGIFWILEAVFEKEANLHDIHDFLNVVGWLGQIISLMIGCERITILSHVVYSIADSSIPRGASRPTNLSRKRN